MWTVMEKSGAPQNDEIREIDIFSDQWAINFLWLNTFYVHLRTHFCVDLIEKQWLKAKKCKSVVAKDT